MDGLIPVIWEPAAWTTLLPSRKDLKPENFLFHTKDLCGRIFLGVWGENTHFFFPPERVGFFVVFFCQKEILLWDLWGLLGGDLPLFFPTYILSCLFLSVGYFLFSFSSPNSKIALGVAFRSSSLALRGRIFLSRALGAGSLKSVCFWRDYFSPKKCLCFLPFFGGRGPILVVFFGCFAFPFSGVAWWWWRRMMMKDKGWRIKAEGWRMKDEGSKDERWRIKDEGWRMKDKGRRMKDDLMLLFFSLGGDPPAPFKIHSSRRVLRKTSWCW